MFHEVGAFKKTSNINLKSKKQLLTNLLQSQRWLL